MRAIALVSPLLLAGCVQIAGIEDVLLDPNSQGGGDVGGAGSGGGEVGGGGGGVLPATCSNEVLDGDETDLDCGGSCAPCIPGKACLVPGDCDSGVCDAEVCQVPSCTDAVANGGESDVDCGGPCQTNCAFGQQCATQGDCNASATCDDGFCLPASTGIWELGDQFPLAGKPYIRSSAFVYDVDAGLAIHYGGFWNGGNPFDNWTGDTHSYAGTGWTLESTTTPGARADGAMVYDRARSTTVLFGGILMTGVDDHTWERPSAAGTWADATPAGAKPSARAGAQVAYDDARSLTVLYGGSCNADTWEYDGDDWTLRTDVDGDPGIRYYGAMVYDAARDRQVMFGGTDCSDPSFRHGDTWERAGDGEWTLLSNSGPAPRDRMAMAYDRHRGRTVLYGGNLTDVIGTNETWEWDGESWRQIATLGDPGEDYWGTMVYDETRKRMVYVRSTGPSGQTWEYSALATSCTGDGDCGTGHCEDALCCNRACLDGESCNTEATPGLCTAD